jgi:hypothetical protein
MTYPFKKTHFIVFFSKTLFDISLYAIVIIRVIVQHCSTFSETKLKITYLNFKICLI